MAHCGEDDDLTLQPCAAVLEPERHLFMCDGGAWVSAASMPPAPAFKFQQVSPSAPTSSSAFCCGVQSSRQSFHESRVPAPASTASAACSTRFNEGGSFQRGDSGPRLASTTTHADLAQAQSPVFSYCDGRPVVNWNSFPQNSEHAIGASSPLVFQHLPQFGVHMANCDSPFGHTPQQPFLTPLPQQCGDFPTLDGASENANTTQQRNNFTAHDAQTVQTPTPNPTLAPAVAPGDNGQSPQVWKRVLKS